MDSPSTLLQSEILWGVALWRVVAAVLIIFAGFASRRVIQFVTERLLLRKARATRVMWDDDAVELVPAPAALVVQVLFWYVAAVLLQLPEEPVDIRRFVFQGLLAALAVALTWVAFRLVDVLGRVLARQAAKTDTRLDDQLIPLVRKTLKVFLAAVVAVMVVQNLGYSVTSLLASLGIGGLAVALAAKDTVANFFGSVVIFTDRPFQVGDWVQFADVEGIVEEVGFRTTRVRRFDKALVTVPNHTFTSTSITNFSARSIRRIKMTIGLTYETTSEQMKRFLATVQEIVADHPAIDQSFSFTRFVEFAPHSLDVQIYCFTKSAVWTEWLEAREDLMLKIMDVVEAQGLEFAYPTQTVYLRDEEWPVRGGASPMGFA